MKFTEAKLEDAIISLLEAEGYPHVCGDSIQRTSVSDVLIKADLRERFRLSESSTNTVSQIITATMDAGLIKLDPNAPASRKYARYLPIWA